MLYVDLGTYSFPQILETQIYDYGHYFIVSNNF